MSPQNINSESINLKEMQDLRLQMVRLEESLKAAIQTTSDQFRSHHEKLETNTKCTNSLKRDLSDLKIKLAERKNIDPKEEQANYQYIMEMRKTGSVIKSAIIKTVVPVILSFIVGALISYGSFGSFERKENIESIVKEHVQEHIENLNGENSK